MKASAPVISQCLPSIWMEFGRMLRLVGAMNLKLLYLIISIFKGEDLTSVILLLKKKVSVGLCSDIHRLLLD